MITTLVQKHPVKGVREFRLSEDEIEYSINSAFNKESLTVVLSVLDPEPVISGSTLAFVSQVNREPLVELFLDRPDRETFDKFVETMRRRITEEDFGRLRVNDYGAAVNVQRLNESIEMLKTYINPDEIAELLSALQQLGVEPENVDNLANVADTFNALGFVKAQVITYAPYINFLLSGVREDSSHKDSYR